MMVFVEETIPMLFSVLSLILMLDWFPYQQRGTSREITRLAGSKVPRRMKTCEGSTAVDETDALACCKVMETYSKKETKQFQRRCSEFKCCSCIPLCMCLY